MKTIYRISLFLNICLLGYLVITCSEYVTKKQLLSDSQPVRIEDKRQSQTANADSNHLSGQTKMKVKSIDMKTGKTSVEQQALPIELIGGDLEKTIAYFDELELHPGLREQEKGLKRIALTNYSPSEISVSKYYKKEDENRGFYLQAVDDYVVVYLSDMQTVYLQTDIYMPDLPLEIQNQILDKKYFRDVTKLYNFLESYSS